MLIKIFIYILNKNKGLRFLLRKNYKGHNTFRWGMDQTQKAASAPIELSLF